MYLCLCFDMDTNVTFYKRFWGMFCWVCGLFLSLTHANSMFLLYFYFHNRKIVKSLNVSKTISLIYWKNFFLFRIMTLFRFTLYKETNKNFNLHSLFGQTQPLVLMESTGSWMEENYGRLCCIYTSLILSSLIVYNDHFLCF